MFRRPVSLSLISNIQFSCLKFIPQSIYRSFSSNFRVPDDEFDAKPYPFIRTARSQLPRRPRSKKSGMKVAVQGCCHGELDRIYDTIKCIEQRDKVKVDLLLICGDFQAVRNESDLLAMAVPPKYRHLGTFYQYYTGEKVAPVPTVFIGGNHEASNYLLELYYGGFVCPNIYFLGFSGVIQFGGLRIAGLSGIYKSHDFKTGWYEQSPFRGSCVRSSYHTKEFEVNKLLHVQEKVDIMLSHDWPLSITEYGNREALLSRKPHFRADVARNELGSPALDTVLHTLRPEYWFSAHLHCKFPALVPHHDAQSSDSDPPSSFSRFLALDKCLPGRDFLQIVDFPNAKGPLEFCYDEEWISILQKHQRLVPLTRYVSVCPLQPPSPLPRLPARQSALKIPVDFEITCPPYKFPSKRGRNFEETPLVYDNMQTHQFHDMVEGREDFLHHITGRMQYDQSARETEEGGRGEDHDEADDFDVDDDDDDHLHAAHAGCHGGPTNSGSEIADNRATAPRGDAPAETFRRERPQLNLPPPRYGGSEPGNRSGASKPDDPNEISLD